MTYKNNEQFMSRAIHIARAGSGRTLPNPLVGAVIVKGERIIGEGYHEYYGGLHAERNALLNVTDDPAGADMYVTLEPCAHHGKTPPCTEAIIQSGIKRVFIGSSDPNPKVSGRGVASLKAAGIEVHTGLLKDECDGLNHIFLNYITGKKPYLMMKYAMTADGKIATHTGDSKWISCEESRALVQEIRNEYPAIMAGIGTVIKDNPRLTCRCEGGTDPVRIICDSRLRMPLSSELVRTAEDIPTLAVCAIKDMKNGVIAKACIRGEDRGNYLKRYEGLVSEAADEEPDTFTGGDLSEYSETPGSRKKKLNTAADKLRSYGVGIINACGADGRTDLKALMEMLGKCGIAGVMLEGGSELNFSALNAGIVNEVNVFTGAKLFGGPGKSPVGGEGVALVKDAFELKLKDCLRVGDDILLKYLVDSKKRDEV